MEISYRNFQAKLLFASGADVFFGTINVGRDIIAFQAKTPQDAENAMKEAVDQYLDYLNKISGAI